MATFAIFVRKQALDFLDYDTPKFVHIRSKKIGLLCRLTQLMCLGYVIGYDLLYEKGYQMPDVGVSGVTAKVKGLQYAAPSAADAGLRGGDEGRVWDPADYVVPPHMNGAFFVTTNVLMTVNQSQSRCAEDPTVSGARCAGDAACPPGRSASGGNGFFTGRCLGGGGGSSGGSGVCEVIAWCPVENDTVTRPTAVLPESRNFTVLIKNWVYFPYYDKHRSNILETASAAYLKTCRYNAQTDPQCPIFRLGDIVDSIGGGSGSGSNDVYNRLALLGGVVSIRIAWDCDLDYSIKRCLPVYSFARLDSEATDALVSQGYNFRYAYNYWDGTTQRRVLVKAYGILFLVTVTAQAGAFHVVPTLMKVGSGLGLLSVSTIVCDFIVGHFYRKRHVIKQKKFDGLDRQNGSYRFGSRRRSAAAAPSSAASDGVRNGSAPAACDVASAATPTTLAVATNGAG